jgi:N-acetylglucosaminyl-diphospho-decaprenol L-rhamnosyltransferase
MSALAPVTKSPDASHARLGRPAVVVAIVNYCTPELTIDCLRSLAGEIEEFPGSEVVIADNASPDGSGTTIARAIADNGWSRWARVIHSPRNGGFAFGNNLIVNDCLNSPSPPRYLWLLNSDTVVRPGALRALVDFMENHPDVGIAGSRLEDPDGTQQCSAFRFHSIASEFDASVRLGIVSRMLSRWAVAPPLPQRSAPFDWVSGASMLVRFEVFRRAGLLDEAYFLYYEETDFCRKARDLGWTCWFVAESRVVHLVGKSSGVTERRNATKRRSSYWFESRRHYFMKNHGRLYSVGTDVALALGTLLWRIRATLSGRPSACPEYFLYDIARHSALLNTSTGCVSR